MTAVLLLGLLPTGLALAGAGLALRDVVGGTRRDLYVPLLWLALGMLAAAALFAWRMPTWAALKASYLLPASLSFALFLARGVEAVARPAARRALLAALALVAVTGTCQTLEGIAADRASRRPPALLALLRRLRRRRARLHGAEERSRWSGPG